jgi:hypothetical protein
MEPVFTPIESVTEQSHPWAALLEHFYRRAGCPTPHTERIRGEHMPQPYRKLLVHSRDMTPTLEGFYGPPLGLTVLTRELDRDSATYTREVVLTSGARPVEYGAIRILLDELPSRAQRMILKEDRPLGGILQAERIAHFGWLEHLGLEECPELYGRRNVLLNASRRLLADVIEILAPLE